MEQYIPKSALVAEIENLYNGEIDTYTRNILNRLKSNIDTLEVKEVDLDFILHEYWDISPKICVDCLESTTMTKDEMINFAKHFFELGLNASNPLTWEDIRLLDLLCCKVDMSCDLEEKEHYEEVLKRFKEKKGG